MSYRATKTRRRQAAAARKTKPSRASEARNILLLGGDLQRKLVARALSTLDAELRPIKWGEFVEDASDDQTVAAVITGPPPQVPLWKSVRTLRGVLPEHVAVVVVATDLGGPSATRRLYAEGAAVVFDWPRESLLLGGVLAETLALRLVHGKATRGDRALARVVRSHARLVAPAGHALQVDVRDGVAHLAGEVTTLPEAIEIESRVAEVPGVQAVHAEDLRVVSTGRSDRAISSAVKRVLSSVSEDTVAVSVRGGHVTLAGSVGSRAEARRLQGLVAHVRGVRGLDNRLVVSSDARDKDRTVAARVRKVLAARFPQLSLEVAAFGGHLVVQGEVQTLATKRDVSAVAEDVDGVHAVINKLMVVRR